MSAIHDRIVGRVLAREGGIKDVGDGQGLTRFGQTPAWLTTWRLPTPTTAPEAAANYLAYMQLTRLDDIASIDEALGDVVFDWSVHTNETVAIQALQALLRVKSDGRIGPITLAAAEAWATAGRARELARLVHADRQAFVGPLLGSRKVDRRSIAEGWCNRLAEIARALAKNN